MMAFDVYCDRMHCAEWMARQLCKKNGAQWADVIGKRRKRPIVAIRRLIASELRHGTDLSLPEIGRLLNRDHSSIINLLNGVVRPDAAGQDWAGSGQVCRGTVRHGEAW